MKRFEHINHEMRKIIASYLTKGKKVIEIANDLGLDISAVSKEAYRNTVDPICPFTLKYPYVCNGCKDKYTCRKKQYKYDVKRAQEFADYRLIASRRGINLAKQEFDVLTIRFMMA